VIKVLLRWNIRARIWNICPDDNRYLYVCLCSVNCFLSKHQPMNTVLIR